jgi:hypothetical protein
MYTKRKTIKRRTLKRKKRTLKKRKTIKKKKQNKLKGGTPSPRASPMAVSPRASLRSASATWLRVPAHHRAESICVKKFPEKDLGNECFKYDENLGLRKPPYLWLRSKYDMNQVTEELTGPILLFNENEPTNALANIKDGIYNFMLFWDDTTQQYSLVLAYFNAFEFGTKHNIINLLTLNKTPDTFIISGEIKKDGANISFHDTSSQYHKQTCNIKRRSPLIYIYSLIDKARIEIEADETIKKADLEYLKERLLKNNIFKADFLTEIESVETFPALKELLLQHFPVGDIADSVIYSDYVDLIRDILADAFKRLFPLDISEVRYVTKFNNADYQEQKNVVEMTKKLCEAPNPVPFEVYATEKGCKEQTPDKKYPFNSCEIESPRSAPEPKRRKTIK